MNKKYKIDHNPKDGLDNKKHILPKIIELLPAGLGNFLQVADLQERDIYILSSIVGLSTCMPNVFGMYRGKRITPHHYLYVAGPPESGKGAINVAKDITFKVNERIYGDYLVRKMDYENRGEDDDIRKPLLNKLYISDDTTGAAFVRSLTNQDNTGSLLVSPEAGTLVKSLGREHGGFLGQLLKAWEHEVVDKDLIQYDEYSVCEFPKLSVSLASNVRDFQRFLGEASSSGLLSRLMLYTTRYVDSDLDVVGSFNYEEVVGPLKNDCLAMYEYFTRHLCEFQLTEEQILLWHEIINSLKKAMKALNPAINSGNKRFAMSLYRQLMVISIYRAFSEGRAYGCVNPTEADFQLIIDLAYLHGYHVLGVYDQIPQLNSSMSNVYEILRSLPTVFRSKDFIAQLVGMGLNSRTAERRLADMKSSGHVFVTEKRGWLSKKPQKISKS